MRTIPDPLYGATLDNVAKLSAIVTATKALCRMPTYRIVFDEWVAASYYAPAIAALQPISYILGEILDSSYVPAYTLAQYTARVQEYLAAHGNTVDIWEVGNEINGDWLGPTSDVVAKMTSAYNLVKTAGKRAALTLYYTAPGYTDAAHEMFNWAQANIPATMKSGLDYVLVSYYEQDNGNKRPTPAEWQTVFQKLRAMFPNAKLGFGEVGLTKPATSTTLSKAQAMLTYYYSLAPAVPGYIGGYFWWYFYEDCLPTTKPLFATLNAALPKVT